MFISDVIEQAKALHPTEYTTEEYIRWCDELSADIRRNYDILYGTVKETSDSVLLPEGVSVNEVVKIVMDGRELDKTNLLDFGIDYEYEDRGRVLKKHDGGVSEFEIVYMVPYSGIRYVDRDVAVTVDRNLLVCDEDIRQGDSLKITEGDNVYNIHILECTEDGYIYSGDVMPDGNWNVHLLRELTENTLLPAPYDSAYVDYVNAKAALYQGDDEEYSSYINQYNVKISDYRKYLTRNMPRKKTKFINWW